MTKASLDSQYWNTRYQENRTGWDIGAANKIHTKYVEKNYPKNAKILIPGAGNAYEAEYLSKQGYTSVFPLDYAALAKEQFLKRNPNFPAHHYLQGNFFDLTNKYDLVLEQTFFCALDPKLRKAYVDKMYDILIPGGKIFGVLFNFDKPDGPPFGGSEQEYRTLFKEKFEIARLAVSTESIAPRAGNEFIIELVKK